MPLAAPCAIFNLTVQGKGGVVRAPAGKKVNLLIHKMCKHKIDYLQLKNIVYRCPSNINHISATIRVYLHALNSEFGSEASMCLVISRLVHPLSTTWHVTVFFFFQLVQLMH